MNGKFNGGFLKIIIIISMLPLVPVFLLSLAPAGLLLIGIIAYLSVAPFRRGVNSVFFGIGKLINGVFSGVFKLTGGAFFGVFRLMGMIMKGFGFSLSWLVGIKTPSSRFMGWVERSWLLRGSNSGPLVDGKSARLSEDAGYESILVQGGMGRGKSSTFVMPNLLNLPASQPSFVISDTSGEIYQNTSGYLASQGYQIRVLNLTDPAQSETYNRLAGATTPQAIADLAKTLVKSANGRGNGQGASDPFWEQSAEKLIRILTQCLQNQPDPSFRNLANLRQLITGFDAHTAKKGQLGKIDQFVLNATQTDPSTFGACHYCARHIVAAGIDEVQFIEPYPKSRATALHSDAITTESEDWRPPSLVENQLQQTGEASANNDTRPSKYEAKVLFRPFVGVSPRMYRRVFLKDRDYKNKVTGERVAGLPAWGGPLDSYKISYINLENKLGREATDE